MSKIIITEEQLEKLKKALSENTKPINEDKDGNYMAKQQLFTIGTLALQMWEILEDDDGVYPIPAFIILRFPIPEPCC